MNENECGMRDNCQNEATKEMHPCPYAQEIFDDDEDVCNCCDNCTYECAMDI